VRRRVAEPEAGRDGRSAGRGRRILLLLSGIALFAGFIALGNWQIDRRAEKLQRISEVNARVDAPAVPAPGPSAWNRVGTGRERYRHVRVTGRFLHADETLVHGTSRRGYGYWVMTPLRTARGFIVLVNRGHVPESAPDSARLRGMMRPQGTVTVTGLLRRSRPGGGVLRSNDPAAGQWYSRDVAALAAAAGLPADRVAPYFIDADARSDQDEWPVAGLTVIRFPNHHLIYALTWYAMAFGVVLAGAFLWWSEQRRPRPDA